MVDKEQSAESNLNKQRKKKFFLSLLLSNKDKTECWSFSARSN